MERLLTFTDVDENRLELWLKPDRIRLVVIDSRPELEAGELRRFAAAVFTEYVGRDLAVQLATAQARLRAACDGASRKALGGAIADALAALDAAAAAIAVPVPEPIEADPDADPEERDALIDASPAPLGPRPPGEPAVRVLTGLTPYPLLKSLRPRRGKRVREAGSLRWAGEPAR